MTTLDANQISHTPGLLLHQTTWELDREEGEYVNHLKATHTEALAEPLIEVPDEFDRNVAITSVDALINWGRKSAVWPLSFGLACCAFEMMARRDVAVRHIAVRDGGVQAVTETGGPYYHSGHGHLEDGSGYRASVSADGGA